MEKKREEGMPKKPTSDDFKRTLSNKNLISKRVKVKEFQKRGSSGSFDFRSSAGFSTMASSMV